MYNLHTRKCTDIRCSVWPVLIIVSALTIWVATAQNKIKDVDVENFYHPRKFSPVPFQSIPQSNEFLASSTTD